MSYSITLNTRGFARIPDRLRQASTLYYQKSVDPKNNKHRQMWKKLATVLKQASVAASKVLED